MVRFLVSDSVWRCRSVWLALLLASIGLALPALANPDEQSTNSSVTGAETNRPTVPGVADSEPPRYWQGRSEGWFWYRDPPEPQAPVSRRPIETRPSELVAFEAMQRRLEDLKRIAVMNPTDQHLQAYMRYQRMVMDKSQTFAERWQRLLWQVPDLDYSLNGRPTNAMALQVYDEQRRSDDARVVQALAERHALLFLFRADCPFCHRFAPILKRFEQRHGLRVYAVSLDGSTLPEFPDARADNGLSQRLQTRSVPALFLSQPQRREIRPVGVGLMSETELLERIATLGREALALPPSSTQSSLAPLARSLP